MSRQWFWCWGSAECSRRWRYPIWISQVSYTLLLTLFSYTQHTHRLKQTNAHTHIHWRSYTRILLCTWEFPLYIDQNIQLVKSPPWIDIHICLSIKLAHRRWIRASELLPLCIYTSMPLCTTFLSLGHIVAMYRQRYYRRLPGTSGLTHGSAFVCNCKSWHTFSLLVAWGFIPLLVADAPVRKESLNFYSI